MSRILRSLAASVLLSLLLPTGPAAASAFPVPEAELEYQQLISDLRPLASSVAGNELALILLAMPYAPLDLRVTRAHNGKQAERLRNFHLGVVGSLTDVDTASLADRFHCGTPCATRHATHVLSQRERIEALVLDFQKYASLEVLASWPLDGHRLNNFFFREGRYAESLPSQNFGFVPSGLWRNDLRDEQVLAQLGIGKAERDAMLRQLLELKMAALVKEADGSVRAIIGGIGDNEAGLLFLPPGAQAPTPGHRFGDGSEVQVIAPVSKSQMFYITN